MAEILPITVKVTVKGKQFLEDAQRFAEDINKLEGMVSRTHKKDARQIVRGLGKRLKAWFDLAVAQEAPEKKPAKRKKK